MFDHKHPQYQGLVECVASGDQEEFLNLLEMGSNVEDWSDGNFEFRDGFLYFEGEQVASQPTSRVVEHILQGFPCEPM